MSLCLECGKNTPRAFYKYCSNKCQIEFQYKKYIESWKRGIVKVTDTRNISKHIKRFLVEKYGNKCSACGWNKKNLVTRRVPLEVDHIDGNASNNVENNLRLLCPNCHSLTPCFRNLNKGNGRKWRIQMIRDKKTLGE